MDNDNINELLEDWDNLPEDFDVSSKNATYAPLPADTYQVEILEIGVKENFFYRPDAPEGKKGHKYSISATLVIIEEGDHYGRRLWREFTPVMKPTGKKGPTLLYKFVSAVLNTNMDFEQCEAYVSNLKNFGKLKGKQFRAGVEVTKKQNGDEKNAVNSFYPSKKDLPPFDPDKFDKNDDKKKK